MIPYVQRDDDFKQIEAALHRECGEAIDQGSQYISRPENWGAYIDVRARLDKAQNCVPDLPDVIDGQSTNDQAEDQVQYLVRNYPNVKNFLRALQAQGTTLQFEADKNALCINKSDVLILPGVSNTLVSLAADSELGANDMLVSNLKAKTLKILIHAYFGDASADKSQLSKVGSDSIFTVPTWIWQ